jgi:hypothetical protein
MFLAFVVRTAVTLLQCAWWTGSGYIAFGVTMGSGFIGGAPGDLIRALGTMTEVLVVAVLIGELRRLLPPKELSAYATRTA